MPILPTRCLLASISLVGPVPGYSSTSKSEVGNPNVYSGNEWPLLRVGLS